MLYYLLFIISFGTIIFSYYIFNKWFNHLSFYTIIWTVMILLYEWRLLPYHNLVTTTWMFIFVVFFSFFIGAITIYFVKGRPSESNQKNNQINSKEYFLYENNVKIFRNAVLIFSFISIVGALQHWYILIDMFGSVKGVFINALKVYKMNTSEGGAEGQWPFISNFGYVAVFWGAIYTAAKRKFTFFTFLPFIGVIIKETSTLGRAGMLLALLLFVIVFMLFRHLITIKYGRKYKFSRINAFFSVFLLATILVISASLVKSTRISYEQYQGASSTLKKLEGNLILSPSIYLYFSAHLGVLNKFIIEDNEKNEFAQNTFLPVYNLLSRLNLLKRPTQYQKGYFIPMWVNTGTFIRELYADFNVFGIFLFPYLLGFMCSVLWYKFIENFNLYYLAILSYLYIIIGFSFLVMITRTSYWIISLSLILLSISAVQNFLQISGIKNSDS